MLRSHCCTSCSRALKSKNYADLIALIVTGAIITAPAVALTAAVALAPITANAKNAGPNPMIGSGKAAPVAAAATNKQMSFVR